MPFGYAVTGAHAEVLLGAGYGIAVGAGVRLRGGSGRGPWTGILIGSIVGVASTLIDGLLPYNGWVFLVLPVLALSGGLIDGIGGSWLLGTGTCAGDHIGFNQEAENAQIQPITSSS